MRLWMRGEIGEGRGWHKEACALAGRKVLTLNFGHGPVPVVRAFAPIGEGRNAACCGRRPLCLRGAVVRLGRRVTVGEEPWGTCSSDVSAGAARPCGLSLGADGPMRAAGWSASQGGNAPKYLLSPDLCPSCAGATQRLPSACACVYSSPSRRTPVDAAARTPRTGYCGRRRRSDRPFRTGLQKGGLRSAERPFESPRLS